MVLRPTRTARAATGANVDFVMLFSLSSMAVRRFGRHDSVAGGANCNETDRLPELRHDKNVTAAMSLKLSRRQVLFAVPLMAALPHMMAHAAGTEGLHLGPPQPFDF